MRELLLASQVWRCGGSRHRCREFAKKTLHIPANFGFGTLAACLIAIAASAPAHAVGVRHPFCIQGDELPGFSNCTFDSYGQCAATASRRFLTCIPNPYFNGESDDPRAYPKA